MNDLFQARLTLDDNMVGIYHVSYKREMKFRRREMIEESEENLVGEIEGGVGCTPLPGDWVLGDVY